MWMQIYVKIRYVFFPDNTEYGKNSHFVSKGTIPEQLILVHSKSGIRQEMSARTGAFEW
jgi:hypothetical protein